MNFIKQIKLEVKNILISKFLLIIGIIVFAASIVLPVINIFGADKGGSVGPMPIDGPVMYKEAVAMRAYSAKGVYYGDGQEPITVENVTINPDNPFYWNINGDMQEKNNVEIDKGRFSTPEAMDLYLSLLDTEIKYYVRFAQYINKPADYRQELAWNGSQKLFDKFIFEHLGVPQDVLMEAMMNRMGMDENSFKKKYVDITPEERMKTMEGIDSYLNTIFQVVENNDFQMYIDLRIQQEQDNIKSVEEQIAIQEQAIINNPSQEENLNRMIEDLEKNIKNSKTNVIPILEYRKEKNIVPGEDIWQNNALSDIENNRSQVMYTTIISEEDFNKEMGYKQQYGTYITYKTKLQARIDEWNNTIKIAQMSLDADKPDMKYVPDGARTKTVQFLDYSIIVALFAILLGGWIMASEYQQGTIRLLMIRPKKRIKILMAKFTAAFLICFVIYLAGSVVNSVVNGIVNGFSDFANPNFTISGEIGFFAYYIPKLFASLVSIVFAFTVAFMLSVLVKNTAVSVAVPIACFIGCTILMNYFAYSKVMEWILYTPIPYVQISSFYVPYSPITVMMQRGLNPNDIYGIIMLLVLSVICIFVSIQVFKRRDITN